VRKRNFTSLFGLEARKKKEKKIVGNESKKTVIFLSCVLIDECKLGRKISFLRFSKKSNNMKDSSPPKKKLT